MQLPNKSKVVLWKNAGFWALNIVYPPGSTIPTNAKPFDRTIGETLAEVHTKLVAFFDDTNLRGGTVPAPDDKGVSELKNGDLVIIERRSDSWQMVVHSRDGGMQIQFAPYSSIADAFEGLRLLHDEP